MKKINVLELWVNLTKKFNTSQVDSNEPPMMLESNVQPTYDVQQSLLQITGKNKDVTVSATGTYVMFTVPNGEKWNVENLWLSKTAGSFTMNAIHAARQHYLATAVDVRLATYTAAGILVYNLPKKISLLPSDQLAFVVDTYSSGPGTVSCNLLVEVEAFNG